jgi:hypothetical protein
MSDRSPTWGGGGGGACRPSGITRRQLPIVDAGELKAGRPIHPVSGAQQFPIDPFSPLATSFHARKGQVLSTKPNGGTLVFSERPPPMENPDMAEARLVDDRDRFRVVVAMTVLWRVVIRRDLVSDPIHH